MIYLALGLAAMGASADFLRRSRPAPQKEVVAYSIWARLEHLMKSGIAESIGTDESDNPRAETPKEDKGIYLGLFVDGLTRVVLRYKGVKHLICFGPTSSGKSMSLIVPNAQNLRRSMIIIDPKGDVTAITARRRKAIGDKVIVLNPFGVLTKKRRHLKSAGWNHPVAVEAEQPEFRGSCDVHRRRDC